MIPNQNAIEDKIARALHRANECSDQWIATIRIREARDLIAQQDDYLGKTTTGQLLNILARCDWIARNSSIVESFQWNVLFQEAEELLYS